MPPKKKLSKKEKARLEAEQAELLRIEMEKEKLKKLEEARQRRKIEREQAKRRLQLEIQENKLRRTQLKNSMQFFNQVRSSIDAIKNTARDQIEWEKYMRCNGLPNANSPSDLRKYIHQWKMDVRQRNHNSRNWLLKTNERTLLTQDISMPNLTKATLRKQQGNMGDVYAKRVKEILGILSELDDALMDKTKQAHTLADLDKLKTEIRVQLKEYLDDFTYKTMSHIERDMEIDRPGVSKHIYDSEVFKSFMWTFSKDAQISLSAKPRIGDQNLHNEIEFPLMSMQVSLPPSVILYSSALRGLWLSYDHLSDYCPSFNLKRSRSQHINILAQTKKEWRKRKEILQNMLDECSKEVPLEELEKIEQERESGSQQQREKNFDVDKLYLEYEEELNKLRRKAIGPESFGSCETDINLRKYRIIGGVYCTDLLETPQQDKQLNSRSFIRTILAPDKLAHKIYYQTYKPPPAPLPGVRRLPEEIEAEMRMVEAALDKLAMVTVDLPDSVIWFEPPIACRWETNQDTFESDLSEGSKPPSNATSSNGNNNTEATPLSTTTNASPLKSLSPRIPLSRLRKKSSQKSIGNAKLSVREIPDFDLFNIPYDVDIYSLVRDFLVPRIPQGFTVRLDTQRLRRVVHKWSGKGCQQQQQQQQRVGGGGEVAVLGEKIPKVLYLARTKNVTFTPVPVSRAICTVDEDKGEVKGQADKADRGGGEVEEEDSHVDENGGGKMTVLIQEKAETDDEGYPVDLQANAATASQLYQQKRLTEDFLDIDEPKEFFPCVQFEKVLKINTIATEDFTEKIIVDTLDLRKRRRASSNLGKVATATATTKETRDVNRTDSKGSLASAKSSRSNQSKVSGKGLHENDNGNATGGSGGGGASGGSGSGTASGSKGSRRSSEESFKSSEGKPRSYMFSQLIEDLDRLCELQMPKEHIECPHQTTTTAAGGGSPSSNNPSVTDDDKQGENSSDGAAKDKGSPPALQQSADMAAAAAAAAAALAYYSGISFMRESDANATQDNNEEEDEDEIIDDDETSSEDEYDDYDDDDYEYFLNDTINTTTTSHIMDAAASGGGGGGGGGGFIDPTITTDDNLTYRSDASGTSAGADKDGQHQLGMHRKQRQSLSDSKKSKLSSETTFTEGKWSARDVHDIKFNEDKLSIQFRSGRLGIFGFALNRYSNMPYQTWEIKPDLKNPGTILFSFTASLISLDITITSQGFCVNSFQGGSTTAINEMIGKTLSLEAIKQILISSAVDIFPDEDAFCYTEGSCEKNYVMEMHLYACISTLGLSHNFSWSRWNLLAGSRTAVLLIRELIEGKKVPNHSTLLVTPLKTAIIECTEVSASFNSLGIAGMEYYADLYQLAQVHAQACSLEKQRSMDPMLRDNAASILMAIRPLSFC